MAAQSQQAQLKALVAQTAVKAAADTVEKALDAELERLDNLDKTDLTGLRQKRLQDLQGQQKQKQAWIQLGHGKYQEVADQKAWFEEVKANDRVICHFYRSTTWRCDIIDKHLAILAPKHIETRFIKIDAEKSPFLCERLGIVVMPTIVMTKDTKTLDLLEGFDELGAKDTFTTDALEKRLAKKGALDFDEATVKEQLEKSSQIKIQNVKSNPTGKAIYSGGKSQKDLSDSELSDCDD